MAPCLHCQRPRPKKGRGLCGTCYDQRAVRGRYAPGAVSTAGAGVCKANARLPPPARPTRHPPGSEDKVAVMEQRAAAGEMLFHPDDARGA